MINLSNENMVLGHNILVKIYFVKISLDKNAFDQNIFLTYFLKIFARILLNILNVEL